jgi:Tfp pilus assembly protein PilO
MMPRKPNKHFQLIVAVVAVAMLTAGWFAYATRRAKLNALQATLKDKQTELANLEPELARRPELEAEYTGLQERLAVLEPSLPTYAYVPTLLRQLERLANETGNRIDAIKPQHSVARKAQPKQPEEGGDGEQGAPSGQNGPQTAPVEKKPPVPYDSVDINVEIQGTYWTTVKFLEQLQRFPKMIAVNEMSVRPCNTAFAAISPRLNVQIVVKAVVPKRKA